MPEGEIEYEKMVEQALRGVVRQTLQGVAGDGLPGEHHFYITFRTDHPDVSLPKSLRERYPNEMTIVMQHQFWNLEVEDEKFEVTLSFSNVPHRLVVPYASVVAFADPSVRFGLQFEVPEGLPPIHHEPEDSESGDPSEKTRQEKSGEDGKGKTNVVTLDTFRKK